MKYNEMFFVEFGELIGAFNSIIEAEREWKRLQNWLVDFKSALYIKTNVHCVTNYGAILLNRGKLPSQIVLNIQLDSASLSRPGIRMTLVSKVSK